jgi:hypothetical protein
MELLLRVTDLHPVLRGSTPGRRKDRAGRAIPAVRKLRAVRQAVMAPPLRVTVRLLRDTGRRLPVTAPRRPPVTAPRRLPVTAPRLPGWPTDHQDKNTAVRPRAMDLLRAVITPALAMDLHPAVPQAMERRSRTLAEVMPPHRAPWFPQGAPRFRRIAIPKVCRGLGSAIRSS